MPWLLILKNLPWKWVGIGIAVIALISGIGFTVHTYNSAIETAEESKEMLKASQNALLLEHSNLLSAQQQAVDLKDYYAEKDRRTEFALQRRNTILTGREKRDEAGNIIDSHLLNRLNGLFDGYSSASDNP